MAPDIAAIFEHQYEKDFLTLLIPTCFEDLSSKYANLEMVVANTIQPMRLPYVSNVVTHAIGIIFNNYAIKDNKIFSKHTKVAEKLLKDELNCEDVYKFTRLSKG